MKSRFAIWFVLVGLALAACAGGTSQTAVPGPHTLTPDRVGHGQGTAGMCGVDSGYGTLAFCYQFSDASGPTLLDSSAAGNNGTFSLSGVLFGTPALTTNATTSEETNGITGFITSGYTPAAGSFSLNFFVDLLANQSAFDHLLASGPATTSGLQIFVNTNSSNSVVAKFGTASGAVSLTGQGLTIGTAANVTLTYNASTLLATLCVATVAPPSCTSATLPSAYIPSTSALAFGGASNASLAKAYFAQAAYWPNLVLTTSQIHVLGTYTAGSVATPAPESTPALVDWTTYQFDAARDGYNPDSAGITPATLPNLHLAWQVSTGGGSQAQPLIATGIAGHQAVVLLAEYNNVEALDAFSGSMVWKTALSTQAVQQCGTAGIGGSMIYDKALGEVFAVAGNGQTTNHVMLSALNAATGAIVNSLDVTPTLQTGEGVNNHTGLTFANGLLYVGTGSDCEGDPPLPSWLGRVVAVNPSSLTIANTFYTVWQQGGNPYGGGGVWSWGGVSSDPNGNVFVATGNAETPDSEKTAVPAPIVPTSNEQAGYAEHMVKLTSNLGTVEDSNYPGFNFAIGGPDLDFAGTPVVFQPPVGAGCSDEMAAAQGKGGTLVVYDTTALNPPVASYGLSIPSGRAYYMGNPAYSPVTGYLYAAIASAGNGSSMLPPGLAAIGSCGNSIVWHDQFGPDSSGYAKPAPRSAPGLTAGGVVFMGTPCSPSGNTCGSPGSTFQGALWAINASNGNVLNGGAPVLITADPIWMAPVSDGDWMYVVDNSGNIYAYTIDPNFGPAVQRAARHVTRHYTLPSDDD